MFCGTYIGSLKLNLVSTASAYVVSALDDTVDPATETLDPGINLFAEGAPVSPQGLNSTVTGIVDEAEAKNNPTAVRTVPPGSPTTKV